MRPRPADNEERYWVGRWDRQQEQWGQRRSSIEATPDAGTLWQVCDDRTVAGVA